MPTATAPQTLDRDWFTVAQTAAYLQCSTRTVRRYIDSGLLSTVLNSLPAAESVISAIAIEKLLECRSRH